MTEEYYILMQNLTSYRNCYLILGQIVAHEDNKNNNHAEKLNLDEIRGYLSKNISKLEKDLDKLMDLNYEATN